MDREILFRGKRADNGEWIYGNLFIPDNPDKPVEILIGTNSVRISYEVIPETVGQYTGLTDKNGKKIFEGDILEFTDADKDITPYEIYWDESSSAWYIRDCEGCIDNCDPWVKEYFEVICNIHDNPELLEVSE